MERKLLAPRAAVSARVHAALLHQALRVAAAADPRAALVLAHEGPIDAGIGAWIAAQRALGREVQALPQAGRGFEARFVGALEGAFALGYARVVAVGADIPDLSPRDLRRALQGRQVALGPAADGGFYLIGLQAAQLGALRGLPWQQPRLLRALLARLEALTGASPRLLPCREDLDTQRQARRRWGALSEVARALLRCPLEPPRWRPRTCRTHLQGPPLTQQAFLLASPWRGPPAPLSA